MGILGRELVELGQQIALALGEFLWGLDHHLHVHVADLARAHRGNAGPQRGPSPGRLLGGSLGTSARRGIARGRDVAGRSAPHQLVLAADVERQAAPGAARDHNVMQRIALLSIEERLRYE